MSCQVWGGRGLHTKTVLPSGGVAIPEVGKVWVFPGGSRTAVKWGALNLTPPYQGLSTTCQYKAQGSESATPGRRQPPPWERRESPADGTRTQRSERSDFDDDDEGDENAERVRFDGGSRRGSRAAPPPLSRVVKDLRGVQRQNGGSRIPSRGPAEKAEKRGGEKGGGSGSFAGEGYVRGRSAPPPLSSSRYGGSGPARYGNGAAVLPDSERRYGGKARAEGPPRAPARGKRVSFRSGLEPLVSTLDRPEREGKRGGLLSDGWDMERGTREEARFPWEREELEDGEVEEVREKKVKPPSMAELTLPEEELRRLRKLAMDMKQHVKVGRLGITDGVVELFHAVWRVSEVVRVRCEGPPAWNMKKTHEDIEAKSGGLVIWRSGGSAAVYRGKDYTPPQGISTSALPTSAELDPAELDPDMEELSEDRALLASGVDRGTGPDGEPTEVELLLRELGGARVEGWDRPSPPPIDADKLIVPGVTCTPPFRLLPYGFRRALHNLELTELRRKYRKTPPHFMVGRNRGLDGLALKILKLWEKVEVVKIGVKRHVQNVNNERISEELKRLTGGVLLARDKYFIVLYRGRDFLPPSISSALRERELLTQQSFEDEESARLLGLGPPRPPSMVAAQATQVADGEVAEDYDEELERMQDSEEDRQRLAAALEARKYEEAKKIERKVNMVLKKKAKAESELMKLDVLMRPAVAAKDRETITEEERFMFQKLGLKMKAYLQLGRRGIFSGVVENMHLHWKYRELVKILIKEKDERRAVEVGEMLAAESGGILVACAMQGKEWALIVYRGKNYKRPSELRPKHLLTKRQALKWSIEEQRRQALESHIQSLERSIADIKANMSQDALAVYEARSAERAQEARGPVSEGEESDVDAVNADKDYEEEYAEVAAEERGFTWSEDESDGDYGSEEGVINRWEDEAEAAAEGGLWAEAGRSESLGGGIVEPRTPARQLTQRERLLLRQEALSMGSQPQFNVGQNNVVGGLSRAIRDHFERHALVTVGVRGRAHGTPIAEIVHQLEVSTGGLLVSVEPSKVIFFRGWADGDQAPISQDQREGVSPESVKTVEGSDQANYDMERMLKDEEGEGWEDEFSDGDGNELSEARLSSGRKEEKLQSSPEGSVASGLPNGVGSDEFRRNLVGIGFEGQRVD